MDSEVVRDPNQHSENLTNNEPTENLQPISQINRNDSNVSSYSKMMASNNVHSNKTVQVELVLPSHLITNDPHGFDSISGVHRRSRPASRTESIIESKSPGFINTRLVNYGRGISHQPSVMSHRQHEEHHPPPSTESEKSKMTRRYFATVSSISYAIFLVIFGAIAFISDAVESQHPIPQIFSIIMLSGALAYFIFLYMDIRMHIQKAKNAVKEREAQLRQYETQMQHAEENLQSSVRRTSNGNVNVQISLQDILMNPLKSISHRYCFATGRHGEFIYLKFGAAWFCFGLLIHSILNLSYQITYIAMDSHCRDLLQLTVDIMFPLYSLFILFFIFKYCNIIINSYRGLARIMLMHAIGTTLAFWIFTIVRETADAINLKNYKEDYNSTALPLEDCPDNELNTIRRTVSPYLYPFVIEFCILIVGIFYMIWANINHCPKKLAAASKHQNNHNHAPHQNIRAISSSNSFSNVHDHINKNTPPRPPSEMSDHCGNIGEHEVEYKSNIVVYADCHASSRGLFCGMMLLILKIVFVILLHIAANNPAYVETGVLIDRIFELTVLIILIIAVIVAYFQTSKLDINHHPISKLDDVLLFIAVPAFFSESIFSMVPAVYNGSFLNIGIIMAQLIQILIQTPFIIDALRRCSNSTLLRKKKPGRELVTFLIISNVALWVYYTFSVKTADIGDERYEFYGYVLWSILNHISLPLIMFYRFHASVCLVDIWRHSYEPGEFNH